MKELNPTYLGRVMDLINKSQFIVHMGIRMEELGRGCCRSSMTLDGLLNALGGIHGGSQGVERGRKRLFGMVLFSKSGIIASTVFKRKASS